MANKCSNKKYVNSDKHPVRRFRRWLHEKDLHADFIYLSVYRRVRSGLVPYEYINAYTNDSSRAEPCHGVQSLSDPCRR